MGTSNPQIITKTYDLLLYLLPQVAKFPRSERYLLGERLELLCFDVLELLLNACYSREKVSILQQANVKLEQARYYVRLCKDLKEKTQNSDEVKSSTPISQYYHIVRQIKFYFV